MRCSMNIGKVMRMALAMLTVAMVAAAQDLSFDGLLKDGMTSYKNGDYKSAAEKFGRLLAAMDAEKRHFCERFSGLFSRLEAKQN